MKHITTDSICKKYLKNPYRFASLINAAFFDDHPINKNNLVLWDGEETNVVLERQGTQTSQSRYRDLIMQTRIDHLPILLALENQSYNDYSMVLRAQNYDSMNYLKQWETSLQKPNERLILPVITFVINWGQARWHCDNCLEGITTGIPISVEEKFNDYHMNFCDVKDMDISRLEDEELRRTIDAIQRIYRIRKENYQEMMRGIELEQESLEFVSVITNNEELYKQSQEMKKGEKKNMCEAMDNVMEYVKKVGMNQGINQGLIQGKVESIKALMKNGNMDMYQAMNLLGIIGRQQEKMKNILDNEE